MKRLRNNFFQDDEYIDEFSDFIRTVIWSERGPLNTEMFFLWSMIRAVKPKLFIESGTFKGWSANVICEALKRNDNGAEFITFGFSEENCLSFAKQRLNKYPFANIIEGDSRKILRSWPKQTRSSVFFIDGPKGRNMPPLFFIILKNFSNVKFIAVHDCQKESSSWNRWYLNQFFGKEFPIMFCDSSFQNRFSYLDEPLIGKPELLGWKPHQWNGVPQDSYGIETGYVYSHPLIGKIGTPCSRLLFSLYRQIRFRMYHGLTMKLRPIIKH